MSCTVGMTVLDAMHDEKLQENARAIGDHLRCRVEALASRFPIVGAVHGMCLYLGLEFVRNRETLEPSTQETAAICSRLLDLGAVMPPTGDYLDVLKIKPPLFACPAKTPISSRTCWQGYWRRGDRPRRLQTAVPQSIICKRVRSLAN